MRTLTQIKRHGYLFAVLAALAVMLLSLAGVFLDREGQIALELSGLVGLLACAASLLALIIRANRLAAVLAVTALAAGLAGLDHGGAWQGTDKLDPIALMLRAIGLATELAAAAILLALVIRRPRRRAIAVVSLGAIVVALGIAAAIHDVFIGVDGADVGVAAAVWRAAVLILLGCAVTAIGRPLRHGRARAAWLFVPAGMAVLAATLLLAGLIRLHEMRQAEQGIERELRGVAERLESRLRGSLLGVERMARSWEWGGQPGRNGWKTDAWLLVDHLPELRAIAWVDASTRVRWLAPLAGSHVLQNRVLGDEPRRLDAFERARAQDRLTLSQPIELATGGQGLIAAAPMDVGGDFGGYIVGFYRLDSLMDVVMRRHRESLIVTLFAGGKAVYRSQTEGEGGGERWRLERSLEHAGATLRLRAEPLASSLARFLTVLPWVTLLSGGALAVLAALTVFQAEVARLQARRLGHAVRRRARVEQELRRYQGELEQRVEERTAALQAKQEELERTNAQLEWLATTDELTGLNNRRHFLELAERELKAAWRYDRDLAVIMFDLDHFKRVNDRAGHQCGDALLAAAAEAAGRGLRATDCLARYGGEEFVVLLAESGLQAARAVAERMRSAIAGVTVQCEDGVYGCTASFGVTALQPQDRSVDALLERADRALYAAKEAGRDRVHAVDAS